MGPLESIETWAQFGLAGLVIFALFCFLIFTSKQWAKVVAGIVSDHKDTVSELSQTHQAERKEWREVTERGEDNRTSTLVNSIDKLERRIAEKL